MLLLAIAHYKGSFYEANRMLPVSLVLITALCFMMGIYFPNHAAMLKIGGFMFLVAAGLSGYGNWLPQVEGGFPPKEEKLDFSSPSNLPMKVKRSFSVELERTKNRARSAKASVLSVTRSTQGCSVNALPT